MKNVYALLALAASLGEVSATFGNGGPKFNCPDNTNNNCPPKLVPGFDWSDLPTGPFSSYGGFQWNKWSCASNFGKRDTDIFNPVLPRTGGKAITGSCAPQKELCPSFGCDFAGAEIEAFSVVAFSIVPEFSCDLEFHFGMGDGSTCKQRSHCDKSGSTVKNTQCGGAKNVTVVYPSQPTMPKPTCSVGIHSMSFDCSPPKTSKPPKTTTLSTKVRTTTTSIIATTTSTTSKVIITTPTSTSSAVSSTAVQSTSTPAVSTSSTPAVSTPQTTLTSVATTTTPVQFTTSTVFTTIVSTVTSCGPEVTNCPGHSTVLTTVTVALSTTICPVTETQSVSSTLAISVTKSTTASVVVPPVSSSTGVVPPASSTSVVVPPASSTSSAVVVPPPQTSTSATLPAPPPVQTLPCPEVLPNCINTWLFSVGCSGNTDSGCYCPDELFVQNIFSCVYAHGETDEIVSQAVVFFQGICAPYVPQNPGIATGASTITSVLTVTASQPVQATYTTVVVTATTVVPCVTNGSTIPGSSITTTITNSLTVPQVGFTTQSSGAVGVIPVTTPIPIVSPTPTPTGSNGSPAPVSPVGTGGFTRTSGLPSVVTAAANKVGSGVGLGLAVLAAVAAL